MSARFEGSVFEPHVQRRIFLSGDTRREVALLPIEQVLEQTHDVASSKECITFSLSGDRFGQPTVRTARKRAFPAIILA